MLFNNILINSSQENKAQSESEVLTNFLKGRKSLLAHPLTETFVHLKGLSTNVFFKLNILIYLVYLISFTALVDWTATKKYHTNVTGMAHDDIAANKTINDVFGDATVPWYILYIIFVAGLFMFTLREVAQFIGGGWQYLKSSENILEVFTIVFTWAYVVMVPNKFGYEVEQIFAAIAVFCAWIEMTLMIGRFPSIGIFTFMMFQVIRQVIKFVFVYISTLMAFALAFHLLMVRDPDEGNGIFDAFWSSLLKV